MKNSSSGYIKLWRKIQNSKVWKNLPDDKTSAWIDLLISASYEDKIIYLSTQKPLLQKRGEYITTLRTLERKWKWGNRKCLNFLNFCQKEKMIIYEINHKGRHSFLKIIICNYNSYQYNPNENASLENQNIINKYKCIIENSEYNDNNKEVSSTFQDASLKKQKTHHSKNTLETDNQQDTEWDLEKLIIEKIENSSLKKHYLLYKEEILNNLKEPLKEKPSKDINKKVLTSSNGKVYYDFEKQQFKNITYEQLQKWSSKYYAVDVIKQISQLEKWLWREEKQEGDYRSWDRFIAINLGRAQKKALEKKNYQSRKRGLSLEEFCNYEGIKSE